MRGCSVACRESVRPDAFRGLSKRPLGSSLSGALLLPGERGHTPSSWRPLSIGGCSAKDGLPLLSGGKRAPLLLPPELSRSASASAIATSCDDADAGFDAGGSSSSGAVGRGFVNGSSLAAAAFQGSLGSASSPLASGGLAARVQSPLASSPLQSPTAGTGAAGSASASGALAGGSPFGLGASASGSGAGVGASWDDSPLLARARPRLGESRLASAAARQCTVRDLLNNVGRTNEALQPETGCMVRASSAPLRSILVTPGGKRKSESSTGRRRSVTFAGDCKTRQAHSIYALL
eukprot:TRINITY_DN2870_c0_g1_i1.p1 TRINITY_DN2870_c0_g1~~TRINITY_DN2870_c0_g1_i1.p1  ORF type:complete len:293 (-),score=45.29 TRINITY_DN2870_c0_g1_i1:138-1016(-)